MDATRATLISIGAINPLDCVSAEDFATVAKFYTPGMKYYELAQKIAPLYDVKPRI